MISAKTATGAGTPFGGLCNRVSATSGSPDPCQLSAPVKARPAGRIPQPAAGESRSVSNEKTLSAETGCGSNLQSLPEARGPDPGCELRESIRPGSQRTFQLPRPFALRVQVFYPAPQHRPGQRPEDSASSCESVTPC